MTATAAFGLGAATSALFLGHHIDRFGPRRVVRLALAMLLMALLVSALSPVVAVLVIAQLAAGMASGIALPAIYTTAVVVAPPGRQGKTIGIVLAGWTLSMVAGVSLSAVIADLVQWRVVYGVISLLCLFAMLSLSLIKQRDCSRSTSTFTPLSALGLAGIQRLLISCCAFMAGFYGFYAYLGDFLKNGLGEPLSANGLVAVAYGAGFGGAVLLDGLVHKISVERALPISLVLVAIVYLLFAGASVSLAAVLAMLVLLGFANHYSVNLLIVRLTSIEPSRRGAIMGLYSTVTNLAVFGGTISFGPVYAAHGFTVIAYVAMALSLLAAMICRSRRT